ncbi:Poly-beta-1,6-N-acetyl-D-glucosamine N-deacetylase [bacterium HR17]|jgi:peptidoglycan/xylan/chitin deacetylase (PgdA/CDA1 family)|uniref:Poly-beta-1,6-N-acetyl-D-glucosamine N-deacetylase n=1 Tax=Candidatus Fervidibacter japonicus TaxID=2035412 RepID=A0A2H5XDG6_9BACT|nr:Poly-beta-1,6-N-acetyl-D-glucosamine N-deacetylase [bacterium HR17]
MRRSVVSLVCGVVIASGLLAAMGMWRGAALRAGVPVFCYHDIAPIPTNAMTTTPAVFEAHLRWLQQNGFKTLTLAELQKFLQGEERLGCPAVMLTFDDGYEGVYTYAYRLLKRYGYHGVIFQVVGKVNAPHHLTWTQLREMVDSGVMEVGVHAYALHCSLTALLSKSPNPVVTLKRIADDWTKAKWLLHQNLGVPIKALAYPQGDYDEVLTALAKSLGFDLLFTTDFGVNWFGQGTDAIKRIGTSSERVDVARLRLKLWRAHFFAWDGRPPLSVPLIARQPRHLRPAAKQHSTHKAATANFRKGSACADRTNSGVGAAKC